LIEFLRHGSYANVICDGASVSVSSTSFRVVTQLIDRVLPLAISCHAVTRFPFRVEVPDAISVLTPIRAVISCRVVVLIRNHPVKQSDGPLYAPGISRRSAV
jgi:hypothetical protein